jgi:hypothetical protein
MTDTHHPDTPRNRGDHDAPHMSPVTPAEDQRTILLNRVSWAAVLAGVVVMLVTQLILSLLGIGIGAATLDPAAGAGGNPSASSFSIGAGIWFVLAGILASLAGGYAAGRLAGKPKESTAAWHGLTAWALTTLVVFYLLTTTVGGLLGGTYRTVTSALGNVAQTVGATAQTAAQVAAPNMAGAADPFSAIEQSLRGASGGNDPAALRDAAVAAVRALVTGNEQQAAEARERAAQAEANATKSVSDAIEGGSAQAINYFIAQKYVEAIGMFATSPNAKTILFPVEATQLMGTLGGIGELAKEVLGKEGGSSSPRPPRLEPGVPKAGQ